jgi:hypothetical protein
MSVLSLTLFGLMFVGIYGDFAVRMSIVETRDPNFDECDASYVTGSIAIAPTVDNLDTVLSPCIYGDMNVGDTFVIKFSHLSEEVPELEKEYEYSGSEFGFGRLKDKKITYGLIASVIQPSSPTALSEIITADLYRNDETTSLQSFTIEMTRVVQSVGESTHQFAVRSTKPKLRKHCLSDSSDISSVVANGDTFYVCAIFYNPICPTESFPEAQTTFEIDVQGTDSSGLIVDLSSNSELDPYTCGEELISQTSVWRYVTIEDYGDLESIDVIAQMVSYGQTTSVNGEFTF